MMFTGTVGIYKITNLVTNKVYIGQSKNIHKRMCTHVRLLKKGSHYNKHLQAAFDLVTNTNFKLEVIIYCGINDLDMYERKLIHLYRSTDNSFGYNRESGGCQYKLVSEETKRLLSICQLGKPAWNKGIPCSDESKEKISRAKKGTVTRPRTEEEKRRISISNMGQSRTLEAKENMSLAHANVPLSEKHRKSISESLKGIKHPNTKFTEDDIIAILDSSDTNKKIAERYLVNTSTIQRIKTGVTWSHFSKIT